MELPAIFPNPETNIPQIESLLDRVRTLDKAARVRLAAMLSDEMDLPYLDMMEREYAQAFRQVAPEHATMLRGRFVSALSEQREFLVSLVRKVLQEQDAAEVNPGA